MGRSQREKGKRVEREAAKSWSRAVGGAARRSAQYCGMDGTADIIATDGVHIEVKGRKQIAAIRFWEQARDDAIDSNVPIVLMKEDRGQFFVLLQLEDLQRLMERISDGTRR